ncbi:hypothetical protein MKX03_021968 [Papaver bracteatum]|nr:hypothetical protein MKX03_021968 [Papaver bracteatum]
MQKVLGHICYYILAAGLNGYMATISNLKYWKTCCSSCYCRSERQSLWVFAVCMGELSVSRGRIQRGKPFFPIISLISVSLIIAIMLPLHVKCTMNNDGNEMMH